MSIAARYPQYAPIARHIEAAQLGRVVEVSETIVEFIVAFVKAFKAPPAPAAIIIDRRSETRVAQRFVRFAPR